MTRVEGLELDAAVRLLEGEGYRVETVETRSRKGVDGSDAKRVIRVLELTDRPERTVQLVYAEFRTAAQDQ